MGAKAVSSIDSQKSFVSDFTRDFVQLVNRTIAFMPEFEKSNPSPRLSYGNSKLVKTSGAAYDLPAILSCPGASSCARSGGCYAMHFRYRMGPKLVMMAENFLAAKKAIENDSFRKLFLEIFCRDISRHKPQTLRIHSSGDFFSQQYVDLWTDILEMLNSKNLTVKAYTYTKSLHLDFTRLATVCNVVQSIGGRFDHLIDFSKPHARVFASLEELTTAGYVDGSSTDQCAIDGTIKVGLIVRPNTKHRFIIS